MQKLEEIILKRRDQAISHFQNYPRWSDIYETKIFFCDDILEIIDYLAQEEKDVITDAFLDGLTHYPNDGDPRYVRDYYNEKFNQ